MVITVVIEGPWLSVELEEIELALKGDGVHQEEGTWIKVFFQV